MLKESTLPITTNFLIATFDTLHLYYFLSKCTSNDLQITAFYIFLVVITEAVNQI